ncbi:9072_t:CDS:1, partial [Dentiscutata heterogama]
VKKKTNTNANEGYTNTNQLVPSNFESIIKQVDKNNQIFSKLRAHGRLSRIKIKELWFTIV